MASVSKKKFLTSRKSTYIIFAVGLAAAFCAFLFFVRYMTLAVHDETLENMAELAEHDINYIETYLDARSEYVAHSGENLKLYNCDSIDELCKALGAECNASDFEFMFLIDTEGNCYRPNRVMSSEDNPFLQFFAPDENYFVASFMYYPTSESKPAPYIAYGVKIDPLVVEGKTFDKVVAANSAAVMQSRIEIESFNGEGFASLIDSYGDYIVNVDTYGSMSSGSNFFESISGGTLSNLTFDDIVGAVRDAQPLSFEWSASNGESMLSVIEPLYINDWSFAMTVPESAFAERSMQLVKLVTLLLAVVLVIAFVIFWAVIRSSTARVAEQAKVKARSELLSSLSHEIRTPIVGMVGLNELMEKNIDDHEKMSTYIEQSTTSTKYLLSLVNDILDMSKLEAGKTQFKLEPVDIGTLIEDACSLQRETYQQRGVKFTSAVTLEHPWVLTDPLHVEQAIMNILGNASKFTPEGGAVTLKAWQRNKDGKELKSGEQPSASTVETVIEIKDTGIGMTPEFVQNIFEPFAQERSRSIASQKGTGLGMAISHDLIVGLGGDIKVESELGKGSCFTICLPAATADPQQAHGAAATLSEDDALMEEEVRETLHGMRILLAEDNDINASIITELLADKGADHVDRAMDGEETCRLFEESEPGSYDIILMDVNMPKKNGCETTRYIRELEHEDAKSILIVACSSNSAEEDGGCAQESGMDGFLEKPIEVENVVMAYRELVRMREAGDAGFFTLR